MKKILIIVVLIIVGVVGYTYTSQQQKPSEVVTEDVLMNDERYSEIVQDMVSNDAVSETQVSISKYICFKADEDGYGTFDKIMFSLDENERAVYSQYKNQDDIRTTDLEFISQDFPDPGFPTYTLTYDASFDGMKFGTYTQTHSGVYDYVEFINDDGEVFNFTNILDESYVSRPCL